MIYILNLSPPTPTEEGLNVAPTLSKFKHKITKLRIFNRHSEQPWLVADQAGDVDLDYGGQDPDEDEAWGTFSAMQCS